MQPRLHHVVRKRSLRRAAEGLPPPGAAGPLCAGLLTGTHTGPKVSLGTDGSNGDLRSHGVRGQETRAQQSYVFAGGEFFRRYSHALARADT